MKDEAATKSGTTLEVLAPYLPYGPFVALLGSEYALPFSSMKVFSINAANGVLYCKGQSAGFFFSEVLPILRPFSQLCTPLADGTIPAVTALYMALGFPAALAQDGKRRITARLQPQVGYADAYVRVESHPGHSGGWIRLDKDTHAWSFESFDDYSKGEAQQVKVEDALSAYDHLRSCHFALPVAGRPLLEGIDYLVKEAGK